MSLPRIYLKEQGNRHVRPGPLTGTYEKKTSSLNEETTHDPTYVRQSRCMGCRGRGMRPDCVLSCGVKYKAHIFSSLSVPHSRCSIKADGCLNEDASPGISTLITPCLCLLGMPTVVPGLVTEERDPRAAVDTGDVQTRKLRKRGTTWELGNRMRQQAKEKPQQLPFLHPPASAETSFHTLIYIYINGSVGSRLVADRVRSEVHRKLA